MVDFNNRKFLDIEDCQYLIHKGYDKPSDYCFVSTTKINDDIIIKHPGLSDDGYYELTVEGGGNYNYDDVYQKCISIENKYIGQYGNFICHAFEPMDIYCWLIEQKHIDLYFITNNIDKKVYYILNVCDIIEVTESADSVKQALELAIKKIIYLEKSSNLSIL